jgi:hypothetical protein
VNFYLGQADSLLNQDVQGDQFVYGRTIHGSLYGAARPHAGRCAAAGGVNSNGAAGVVSSKSVDKVSVSYDVSG